MAKFYISDHNNRSIDEDNVSIMANIDKLKGMKS
jgi:hypothetical protein